MVKLTDINFTLAGSPETCDAPLSVQITGLIGKMIEDGVLKSGDRVPPARVLAQELAVSRGTVTTAMDVLVAGGLLQARPGSGLYVSAEAATGFDQPAGIASEFISLPENILVPDVDNMDPARIDFRPCRPSLKQFPLMEWRKCLAKAADHLPAGDYDDPAGSLSLRQNVVDYLRRARGMVATPDQIIITNGGVHAMQIIAALYLDQKSQVIIEDPGYPLARQIFIQQGAGIIPCPVDDDGICVDQFPNNPDHIRFVYVTPSHQFPMGGRMSLARRHALIAWARQHGVIILEDDYDGEFRFDVPPLAPLASIASDCVVYCGTFSKSLFPGLRIGYAIAPSPLISAMAAHRQIAEYAITQAALARFIETGQFERHIHRMRRTYAQRRRYLGEVITSSGLEANLTGMDAGLHGLVRLPAQINAEQLSRSASGQGVFIPSLDRYAFDGRADINGLIAGYAALDRDQMFEGMNILAKLARDI